MINLSKQRIAIYLYFTLVFSLIFGLSFTVQGEKISGAFIVEITSNIVEKVSLLALTLIIFVFLFALAISLFVIRHAQESGHIHHTNVKKIITIVIALNVIGLLSIGVYFGSGENKITGFQIADPERETSEITSIQSFTILEKALSYVYSGKFYTQNGLVVHRDDRDDNGVPKVTNKNGIEVVDQSTAKLALLEARYYTQGYLTKDIRGTTSIENFIVTPSGEIFLFIDSNIVSESPLEDGDITSSQILEILGSAGKLYRAYSDEDDVPYYKYKDPFTGEETYQQAEIVDGKYVAIGGPITDGSIFKSLESFKFARRVMEQDVATLIQAGFYLAFGDIINEQLQEICEVERKSSEPFSSTPSFSNFGPTSSFNSFEDFFASQTEVNCQNSLTTVTAQARKTQTGQSFEYETSFTITACKQAVSFNVFLENEQDINFKVADGLTNLGSTSSETRVFSDPTNFNIICVDTSDPAIGSNGKVCFSVVEN